MGRWAVSQKPKLTMVPLRSSPFEGEGGLCAIQQVTQTARKKQIKKNNLLSSTMRMQSNVENKNFDIRD